jgi:hypothetical protein
VSGQPDLPANEEIPKDKNKRKSKEEVKTVAKVQKRIDEVMRANKESEQKIGKSECVENKVAAAVDTPMEDIEKPQDQLVKSAKKSKKEKPVAPEIPKKEEVVLPEKVSQNKFSMEYSFK